MAKPTIQVEKVDFFPEPVRGEEGQVWYLVLTPCDETCQTKRPGGTCAICCATHPKEHHHYLVQAFARDGVKFREGSTPEEQSKNRANIWRWNGDREKPTVDPSFLVQSAPHIPRVHLFLRAGAIDLCSDSGVVLDPSPMACIDIDIEVE